MRTIKIKNTFISDVQPPIQDGLWLKEEEGGIALYLIERGNPKPLKVVNDQGTTTPIDDVVRDVLKVTNITTLTTKQCNALNVGDQVIKITGNQKHLYTVTYKEDKQGMCLSYIDAENAETVAYDYNGTTKKWGYTDTTITPLTGNG